MGNTLSFPIQQQPYCAPDYLEPGEQGLLIATENPRREKQSEQQVRPNARVFLYTVGKPRSVYTQAEGLLRGLVEHEGKLLSLTMPSNSEREEKKYPWLFIRDLITGDLVVPHHLENLCSYIGSLYGTQEKYHETRSWWDKHRQMHRIPAYHDSFLCRSHSSGALEVLSTIGKATINAMIPTPEGIVASTMASPRGDGNHQITNLKTGAVLHSAPPQYDGYDIGQYLALCSVEDQVLFSKTTTPQGVYTTGGTHAARFPLVDWIKSRVKEIVQHTSQKEWSDALKEVELRAQNVLGYAYDRAMSAANDSSRLRIWEDARERRDDPDCLYRRIALSNYIEHRFYARHLASMNRHLILSATQNLYAVPYDGQNLNQPITIDPRRDRIWTFEDNITGLAVVSKDILRVVGENANVRMGRKAANSALRLAA